MLPPLKVHQSRGLAAIKVARSNKGRPIMAVAPPGAGKSRCMMELARSEVESGGRVLLKVHRKMLLDQLVGNFSELGLDFGVISPDYPMDPGARIQIASSQTLFARAVRKSSLVLPEATLIINDEAHQQASKMERALIFGSFQDNMIQEGYSSMGVDVVGFSATPIMDSRIYSQLVDFGSYSELRKVGMHQLVKVFGPDEIDTQGLVANRSGEFSESKLAERSELIFGSVYGEWKKLNPFALPAILFAPSVPASRWFAQEFYARGVPVAHIDGETILMPDGTGGLVEYASTKENRDKVLEMSKIGEIKCIMNRFVLREAIDMPWLYHGIFATVMGSLTTFLQSVGRLQRFWPDYDHKILQCHGGCLDSETQVLTQRGWLGQGQVVIGDLVAAMNLQTNAIEWQVARSTYVREVNERDTMHVIRSKSLDIRVTGNHKAIYKNRTSNKHNQSVWPSLYCKDRFDTVAKNGRMRLPIAGVQAQTTSNLTDSEIKFLGWWITDGTVCRTNVSISQKESYHEHIADIRQTLLECGFHWTETLSYYVNKNGKCEAMIKFNIPKGTCKSKPRSGWKQLEDLLDKGLSPKLDRMDCRQFELFLHAIHLGDGAKDRKQDSYRISCANLSMMDRLQSMAVRRGWKCNITTTDGKSARTLNMQRITETTFHGTGWKGNQAKIELEQPTRGELVWCVENDLGTLITRRNGKVAIVGNSYWRHGSPNEDREWRLGMTSDIVRKERVERLLDGTKTEGIRCPKCGFWRSKGPECFNCKHAHKQSVRVVRTIKGTLKKMTGNVYKKPKSTTLDSMWTSTLFMAGKSGKTVGSAVAICSARCIEKGIQFDASKVTNKPPSPDSNEWHLPVSKAFPWTVRRKQAKK